MAGKRFDVIVIGSGPGGYFAAIRSAQLGMKTAIVEKSATFGGTCLNIGCIPSKALLDSSEFYQKIGTEAATHGIGTGQLKLDLATLMRRKDKVVKQLTGGVASLLKGNGIETFAGIGRLLGSGSVEVAPTGSTATDKAVRLEAKQIILASGSVSAELPNLPYDGKQIVSSTEALSLDGVPGSMVVVGGGAIGLELGSVWSRLGASVQVVELMGQILPGWDSGLARALERSLTKQGMKIATSMKITGVKKNKKSVSLTAVDKSRKETSFSADVVLVAVGRKPYTEGLGLSDAGVRTDDHGRIEVDAHYRTSIEGVYAIGDAIRGPMLAHKAEDEGLAVAELIAGKAGHVNYDAIPGVVYTWPEAASVGKTEEQLNNEGISYRAGNFTFRANGRALASESAEGFAKILAHEKTDRVLGVHILGPWASDLISEAVTVMEFGGSSEDIARTVHAHPTLTEVVREAALDVEERAIHSPPAKK